MQHVRVPVDGQSVHAVLWGANGSDFRPGVRSVIFSHGFTVPGFESNRMFWRIAKQLSESGWQSVLFDYRGSGYSDMEFSDMTIQSEQRDLDQVLGYVQTRIGGAPLALWGMSLGTSVAAEVLGHGRYVLDAVILWGLSAELYSRWSVRWTEQFEEKGYAILPSGFIVKPAVVNAMKGVDTYASLRKITSPILCVAGGADPNGEARMSRIAESQALGDFTYREFSEGVHGFKGQPELFAAAVNESIEWLSKKVV